MFFDDIVIGSGLSALATCLGLKAHGRRIFVIGGRAGGFRHYPGTNVPADFAGLGGLGQYWHGVIPLSLNHRPFGYDDASWDWLAQYFYPRTDLVRYKGSANYFVPRAPVRPARAFAAMLRASEIGLVQQSALHVSVETDYNATTVTTELGHRFKARHVWFAAGATNTPALLARSGLIAPGARRVSDHVICYAGRTPSTTAGHEMMANVSRQREGVFFPFRFGNGKDNLVTLRPARFDFVGLDSGIAKRAVFGLPTNRVVASVAGNFSPGLIAEAAYNKFGLFPQAPYYSVYVQTVAANAWVLDESGRLSRNIEPSFADVLSRARSSLPFEGVELSRQADLYLPGIHLHGSLSVDEANRFGVGREFANLHVVDASGLQSIGPEHHSFAMMAAAYGRAFALANQD